MIVKELMAQLATMNPEAEVITEGCDCDGDVAQVSNEPDGTVYLQRTER